MVFTATEEKMWDNSPPLAKSQMSDEEINAKYEKGEKRIITEMNREKLPTFAASLKQPGYMETRPFYQRRDRWDEKKQSRLIESFLINFPVPPIFIYENQLNSYEVIDGQQRITAIRRFYDNQLQLQGLEIWPELNGRTYDQLPDQVKVGINRRSITFIVILGESISDLEEAFILKQLAFERINTGGVDLSRQEVRNCLYSGKFNSLLFDLAYNPLFAQAWGIPIDDYDLLKKNNLYKKMEDIELVLRFFALRHIDNFKGKMEDFLNLYMKKSLSFSDQDIETLRQIFIETIELAHKIYEENLFKPFNPKSKTWQNKSYKAYYDAVMVGFSNYLSQEERLIDRKERVIEETKKLLERDKSKLFTGQGKTKKDLQNRIKLFSEMLARVIEE